MFKGKLLSAWNGGFGLRGPKDRREIRKNGLELTLDLAAIRYPRNPLLLSVCAYS
jgi:hypothetical protein